MSISAGTKLGSYEILSLLGAGGMGEVRKTNKAVLGKIGWTSTDNQPHPLLPAYAIKEVGGVKLGFIGMTLKGTPQIVVPTGVQALTFQGEADTANRVENRTLATLGNHALEQLDDLVAAREQGPAIVLTIPSTEAQWILDGSRSILRRRDITSRNSQSSPRRRARP